MTKSITIDDLIDEVAATHRIGIHEAVDEAYDAIEILWAPEDRPQQFLTTNQRGAIVEYIAGQYRTNRTRL